MKPDDASGQVEPVTRCFYIVFGLLSGVYWWSHGRPLGAAAGFALAAFGLIGPWSHASGRDVRAFAIAVPAFLVVPVIGLLLGDSLASGIENGTFYVAL